MFHSDQELIWAYTSIRETVDRIACFNSIREKFFRHLPNDLREEDKEALVWRLFQLRESGKLNRRPQKG